MWEAVGKFAPRLPRKVDGLSKPRALECPGEGLWSVRLEGPGEGLWSVGSGMSAKLSNEMDFMEGP